ncbi:ArsR/SmtB family transcription factor [Antarctobacter heliothermus]|uniref:Transcriptional regulator, ArsR family n=1 Tax=Antarctobacter heliothermus TaxID=74033 RepID=A0A239CWG9_9RHOB|nr:metalloregulator ArsR/SmtB family transcription factor [Antarctobacter heliothermus]SNS24450.1 transcriptional regulator, ArsR family [Antarctobacter heliothermus]
MEKIGAISTLSALAHDIRIDVFRLLIRAGASGVSAGQIAETLKIRPNTLSNNLSILSGAGLVTSLREGRSVRYFANMDAMHGLLSFLMEECCGGRADLCQPLLDQITCAPPMPNPTEPDL